MHRTKRNIITRGLILFIVFLIAINPSLHGQKKMKPNIVFVLIDDMGWGDFSCFGNTAADTPNVDAIAKEGIRFNQFYVNSPICSPSRVAFSTGQYPQRHQITSYLAHRKDNKKRGIKNWLSLEAPMLARYLKEGGYATGHFGKWHMGGQRDVNNAPPISAYGFDESLTNFEGMGAKLLPLTEVPNEDGSIKKGRIWEGAENLGEPVKWMLRSKITGGFVDGALKFIDKASTEEKPFYVNVWMDDVHTPFFPSVGRWADDKRGLFLSVLEEMDEQLSRLFDRIKNDKKLRENTIIIVCSDNGPEIDAGSAGPFKGLKATLFEGGIRSPLIVWGPGFMDGNVKGSENKTSILSAIDFAPSILELLNIEVPSDIAFDGQNMLNTMIGKSEKSRDKPIFFRRPPDRKQFRIYDDLPDLAVRKGQWKLLCDYDGSRVELYDLTTDPSESNNLAETHREVKQSLVNALLGWNSMMPMDAGDPNFIEF